MAEQMGKPITFFEVISPDVQRAQKFYAEVFGWQMSPDPVLGEYHFVATAAENGLTDGGIGPITETEPTPGVKIYAMVEDLDATLESVQKQGGSTLVPATDLPQGYGRFAIFADPDGNRFGLWKAS
jgi:uncharacterized protein